MKRKAVLLAWLVLLTLPAIVPAGMSACSGSGCLRGRPAPGEDPASPQDNTKVQEVALPKQSLSPTRFLEPRTLTVNSQAWRSTGVAVAENHWCRAMQPAQDWRLNYCSSDAGLDIKVVTYNLFWWNLFGINFQNGNRGSAGRLLSEHHADVPFDFMAFQECEDARRVLREANLSDTFEAIELGHAIAIAYRKTAWWPMDHDLVDVAEDQPGLYGRRSLLRARFHHIETGKTVLIANHHGPLMLNTGGLCGGTATAWNILRAIGERAQDRDAVILLGDFNAKADSDTVRNVEQFISRHYTGSSFGGVDHIFGSCSQDRVKERKNLGSAGSDHDALMEVLTI